LSAGLLACHADEMDVDVRANCQIGAWKAMCAIVEEVPLGASHAIGHQVRARTYASSGYL
jgi:maleylacetate reductase